MTSDREKYGHYNKDKDTIAQMKLVKFTRNKLKLASKKYDEASANKLIEEYYTLHYRLVVNLDFKQKCVEIQKDFGAYRSWLIKTKNLNRRK